MIWGALFLAFLAGAMALLAVWLYGEDEKHASGAAVVLTVALFAIAVFMVVAA